MTIEETQARIKELEAELKQLKRQKLNSSIKEEFKEEFPFVVNMAEDPRADMCRALSLLVRQTCFQCEKITDRKLSRAKAYMTISVKEMTVEQINKYKEIVKRILEVIADYQILTTPTMFIERTAELTTRNDLVDELSHTQENIFSDDDFSAVDYIRRFK